MTIIASFADTIKRLRHLSGLTQAELARRVGICPTAISAYEVGRVTPRFGRANLLLKALGYQLAVEPAPASLDRRIQTLGLSVRAENCMLNDNIRTLGELAQKTETELLRVPNLGRGSLNEIKELLAELGLKLRANNPVGPPPCPEPKMSTARKRATLSTRITRNMRAQLDAAVATSGRSLSQEIELRLARDMSLHERTQV